MTASDRLAAAAPGRRGDESPFDYDLLCIGAGASTSYVLLSLLAALIRTPPAAPLRIGVVDRAPDPFTGVPYGGRAARTALLITALRDFLPDGERALFVEWLAANKHWVFDEFVAAAGPSATRWWTRHEADIRADRYEDLFLPRYTFGEYLARRTDAALARAVAAGVATTEVLQDDVVAISPATGGYLVRGDRGAVAARRVLLATGSPPVRPRLQQEILPEDAALVDDPFESMGAAVHRICAGVARRSADRAPHVVLIGGNAGTMDMLYRLSDEPELIAQRTVFTVVSPSGQLPERIDREHAPVPFRAERLESLGDAGAVDAAGIYLAALDDIDRGRAEGLSVADTLVPISRAVVALLPRLSPDQAVEFADRWGIELGRHQRRAGWEYCEVVEHLAAEDRLSMVAGSFSGVVRDDRGQIRVRYAADGAVQELDRAVDAVVNCAGPSRSLRDSAPPLLSQLVSSGVCRLTPSGGGITVDETLAAAPGLHVMGPLLAGNVINGSPVWHMEHCGRISAFGSALGTELARSLVPQAA